MISATQPFARVSPTPLSAGGHERGENSGQTPGSQQRTTVPKIIGFTGPAGAGKTTAAFAVVASKHDYCRLSFADPIRHMLMAIGVGALELGDGKHLPNALLGGKTPRHAMQTLGTEWGRQAIGPDIWINASRRRLLHLLDLGHRAVFDDVRFDNEARMIREHGDGIVIQLDNPNLPARMSHASEAGISPELVDHRITATSVDDLRTQVFALLNDLAL